MKINSINSYTNIQDIQNKKTQINTVNHTQPNFLGTPRVDKSMVRFYEFNLNRFPSTVKNFLEGIIDKFKFTPLEAQKSAFIALLQAKNIKDVQELFPEESLFADLKNIEDTKATNGILGIYREFKDLFDEGILKNGEDLSVYLLKKIFLEAKTLDEINADIKKDLNEDIKTEFERRYKDSEYIVSSTLKSLGIMRPDTAYQNSLKFTREGYSDEFGLKISQAQLKYWNSLTDEQKFEILSKRCEGRDNWWNNLSYDEKLELAAGVDSEEDLYKNYKKFVRARKKEIKDGTSSQTLERPTGKIKVGKSDLKDIDIFNLWFRKNIEKFYAHLSEADKDSVHIKRVRKLAVRWQEMTSAERTELINKMREGREPLRFAMIDAWNHSRVLIRELSEFLSAQQILKPVDMLYDTKEFSEFQSKVMTEFWENHRDLAEEFGKNLSRAISRVETSIQRGQFEDLKQEILRDRAYRIKLIAREKYIEEQKLKESEQQKINLQNAEKAKEEQRLKETESKKDVEEKAAAKVYDYKQEFREAYRRDLNSDKILPANYVEEMIDLILDDMPQDIVEKMTQAYKKGTKMPNEVIEAVVTKAKKENRQRGAKLQNAIAAAIANELCAKGANPMLYGKETDDLIIAYRNKMHEKLPKKQLPDANRIQRLYNEYKKDLTEEEIYYNILHRYFITKTEKNNIQNNEFFADYIRSYGRTALILFSDKSAYPTEVKMQFNEKFLRFMPQEVQSLFIPVIQNVGDVIREQHIQQIRGQIARRFDFLPDDLINTYTQEAGVIIRLYEKSDVSNKKAYSIESFKEKMCIKRTSSNLEGTCLRIPKHIALRESKIKLLAGEQALADELYRITGNKEIFKLAFEDLCNIFELFSVMRDKIMEIVDDENTLQLVAKTKPKRNNVLIGYHKYLKELNDKSDIIFNEGNIKNQDELLYALNQEKDNDEIDKNIMQRIEVYMVD